MRTNEIKTKIKLLGSLFIVIMTIIVITTIYLNQKNKKDALVINIAGKERMLTQKISKNIFYLYQNGTNDFSELDNATEEFIYNLKSLKNGNRLTGITKVPNDKIAKQISDVQILWNSFDKNVQEFKTLLLQRDKNNEKQIKNIVNSIYNTNNNLLEEVDNLVSMYTVYMENKTDYLRYIQYVFALIILILIGYSFSKLKAMEENVRKFFEFSKQIIQSDTRDLKPIQFDAEQEIVEATDTLNCFITKVNSAVNYSAQAIEQSKNASIKLEEITDEFDKVIGELANTTDLSKQLNRSEDMVIESTEELINSTKKLQELKKELDKVLKSCQIKDNQK